MCSLNAPDLIQPASESFAQRLAQIFGLGVELGAVIADEQETFSGTHS